MRDLKIALLAEFLSCKSCLESWVFSTFRQVDLFWDFCSGTAPTGLPRDGSPLLIAPFPCAMADTDTPGGTGNCTPRIGREVILNRGEDNEAHRLLSLEKAISSAIF